MLLRVLTALFATALCLSPLRAQEVVIPRDEIAHGPSRERVAMLVQRAAAQGWGGALPALRDAAFQSYEANTGYAAQWYYLYRWAELLATPYNRALDSWIKAVEAARAGHPNMASNYETHPGSLTQLVSPELQLAMLGNDGFSEEFFQLQSPLDNPMQVLSILQALHKQDANLFNEYTSLALAIAVVYDVPPPPGWPHGQVPAATLPRRLPPPEQAFLYWVRLDHTNASAHRLRRLPAGELKFLVDEVAPFAELDWARKNMPQGLADLPQAYSSIKYRRDRLALNQPVWTLPDYHLPTILAQGGICVDQAYFASTVGKAKGIPTIMFRGAGLDGRHAWFGYLDANQRWQLDCGRYEEQKFVVGLAYDPQTWTDINDYQLLFITERFRALPTFKLSVLNGLFAAEYLKAGKGELAVKAAREAVNRDRRNLDAWKVLLAAQAAAGEDSRAQETTLREAKLAFQKYPDVELSFSRQLTELMRARGEGSVSAFEEQQIGKKYQSSRVDLAIEQAAATVQRSVQHDDVPTQIQIYNKVVDTEGGGAAIDFYDKVVAPFVVHLAQIDQIPAALRCLDHARRVMRVEPGKQLDEEMSALAARLRAGKR